MDEKCMETESGRPALQNQMQIGGKPQRLERTTDSGSTGRANNNNNNDLTNGDIFSQTNNNNGCHGSRLPIRTMDDGILGISTSRDCGGGSGDEIRLHQQRTCPSPVTAIVGNALNQMHLKRSSSAPMINQLGISTTRDTASHSSSPVSTPMSGVAQTSIGNKDSIVDMDASSLASSFLSSFSGARPRRFSASFSPGSPGPAPNRVSQLRQENTTDWETVSEKEFHGTVNIQQSWEDLSLDSMTMEVGARRPSISDQLWLSMPTSSAPSSPAASPRVLSRFSPSLSSPSPTRKSFTTRRSLSPIAVRPSVLTIGQGVKRKCDWDSNSNQMDCSPQPAKRVPGLLSFNTASSPLSHLSNQGGQYGFNFTSNSGNPQQSYFNSIQSQSASSPFNLNNSSTSSNSLMSMLTNHVEDSPFSNETESSVSSIGGCDSPFFRPVESPLPVANLSDDSPQPPLPKV